MTAAGAPSGRRSLLGTGIGAVSSVLARSRGRERPGRGRAQALVAQAREHVIAVAALTSVDIGAFHAGPVWGWVVTGVSLLALDLELTGQ